MSDHAERANESPTGGPRRSIELDARVRTDPDVAVVLHEGQAVLLHPTNGTSHLLDGRGTLVLQCLDGASTLREIAGDIAEVLGADADRVAADVLDFAVVLATHGLLEGYAADPSASRDRRAPSEGLPVGTPLGGIAADLPRPTVLVSWGTHCDWCTLIAPELAALQAALCAIGLDLLLVTTGTPEHLASQLDGAPLPRRHVPETPDFFAGLGTPVAYCVDAGGTVREPLARGAIAVPGLIRRLTGTPEPGTRA